MARITTPRLQLVSFDRDLRDAWRAGRLEAILGVERPAGWDGRGEFLSAWSEAPDNADIWRGWGPWLALRQGAWMAYANFYGPPRDGEVEIGFEVAPAFRGQGLATEMVAALSGWAFKHGAVTVAAMTTDANAGSIGVLTRCGFGFEGWERSETEPRRRYALTAPSAA